MVGSFMEQRFKYGVRNFRYEGMFTGLLKRYQANFDYGETYCVNKNLQKYNTKGESVTCLYIRDEKLTKNWKAEQQRVLDDNFPECKYCPVYFMCGGGCLKSKAGILNAISIKNFLAGLRLNTKSGKGQVMPIKNLFVFPNAVTERMMRKR